MAASKEFKATIALGGKIQASLGGAVRAAQTQLNRLGKAAAAIGQRIRGAFGKLGGVLKSFAVQLVGVALAFAGLQSAGAFIAKSTQEFEANAEAAAKLNAALANNPKLVKLGTVAIAKQQEAFAKLANEQQAAGVYAGVVWTEGYTALAQYGAGVKDATKLSKSMGDLLAKRKGFKATAEDAKALGQQIGLAVSSGKLGKLGKELGITDKEAKNFSKGMKTAAERVAFLDKKIQARAGGQQAALAGTDKGRIQQAQNLINDMQSRLGEGFQEIERKWKEMVVRMIPVLEPLIKELTKLASIKFDEMVAFIEKTVIPAWNSFFAVISDPAVIAAWNNLKKAVDDFFKPFGDALNAIINKLREWFGIKPPEEITKADWITGLTNFFNTLAGAIEWVTRTTAAFRQGVVDAVNAVKDFKLPDWLTNFKLPTVSMPNLPTLPELKLSFAEIAVPNLDFTPIINSLNKVGDIIKEIAKLFTGWDVPAALLSGLTALGEKLGLIKSQAEATSGVFASTGRASGGSVGSTVMEWQHGGLVKRPTFGVVGEAGPEAVVPLTRSARSLGLLGAAAGALGVPAAGPISVDYKPVFNLTGTGPELAKQLEGIVRAANDDLMSRLEAVNHEQRRTAFA